MARFYSGLLILLTLRNFIIVIIVPAIIAWLLANRWPKYGLAIFTSLYLFFGVLFFTARYLNPRLDFPQAVVNKQQDFMQLKGGNPLYRSKNWNRLHQLFKKHTPGH